jgi:hypothetical protein
MTGIRDYLASRPDRCSGCGFHVPTQGCACPGQRLKFAGQAIASAAHPDDRAKVDAAIRQLAATGRPFSANEVRVLTGGVRGGVVGAAFNSASQGRTAVIKATGDRVPSTDPGTHAHRINVYIGRAA